MAKNTRSNVYEGGILADPTIAPGVPATIGSLLPQTGTTNLWQKFGALDTDWQLFGGAGTFPPSRIAVVDPTRGNDATGAYGGLPFLTITGAMAAAPAMLPTPDDPCAIWIAPGTYNEAPLVCVSNVHMIGFDRNLVTIQTAVSWTAAAGVNFPQAGANEFVSFKNINFLSLINTTTAAKVGSNTLMEFRDCGLGALTEFCRAIGGDASQMFDCNMSDSLVQTNGSHNIFGSQLGILNVFGAALTSVTGCIMSIAAANGTSTITLTGTRVISQIGVAGGCFIIARGGCSLESTITSGAGGLIDLRGSQFNQANLVSLGGPIDRSTATFTLPASALGVNVIVFAALVPAVADFPDATYNVTLTPTAGSVGTVGVITAKAATGFTYNDANANQVYDVTINKV